MLVAVGLDLGSALAYFFLSFVEPRPTDDLGPLPVPQRVESVAEGCLAGGAVGGEEPDAAGSF